MRARVLTEYESWLDSDNLVKPHPVTREWFADFLRKGFYVFVLEDEESLDQLAVATFTKPSFINAVVSDGFWIRPDLRGKTWLLHSLIKGILEVTGRALMIAQAQENLLESNRERGIVVTLEPRTEQIYSHKGMFIYAPE